ncbi:MAG: hypothetical protein V1863_03325 [Candidatus Omnitrophota bacterium]
MKRTIYLWTLIFILWAGLYVPVAYSEIPTLSLQDSIPVAEEALASAQLKLTDYYIYSIMLSHAEKGFYWYYTLRSKQPSEYNQIYIRVYMDKTTEIRGGPSR